MRVTYAPLFYLGSGNDVGSNLTKKDQTKYKPQEACLVPDQPLWNTRVSFGVFEINDAMLLPMLIRSINKEVSLQ